MKNNNQVDISTHIDIQDTKAYSEFIQRALKEHIIKTKNDIAKQQIIDFIDDSIK